MATTPDTPNSVEEKIDTRETWIKVIGKLGRETQLHLDDRYRRFQMTDYIILGVFLLLLIVAVFNIYYVSVLYRDLGGIVINMDSMHQHLEDISTDMESITGKMSDLNNHVGNMENINIHMGKLSASLSNVRRKMDGVTDHMGTIADEMALMSGGMSNIDWRFNNMAHSVSTMRYQTRQMSKPMGWFPVAP